MNSQSGHQSSRGRCRKLLAIACIGLSVVSLALPLKAFQLKKADDQKLSVAATTADETAAELTQIGLEHYREYQLADAIQAWQQALELYRAASNLLGQSLVANLLAAAHIGLDQYAVALEFAQSAANFAHQAADVSLEAEALGNQGIAYRALGNYSAAIAVYQQALTLMQQQGDRAGEAQLRGLIGNAHESLGDYAAALAAHQQSLEIAQSIGDLPAQIAALGNLGAIYMAEGNSQRAIAYYQASLEIAQTTDDLAGVSHALFNLGGAYHSFENFDQAQTHYQQSLDIAQQIGQRRLVASSLSGLGLIAEDIQDYAAAQTYYQQSLAIAQSLNDPRLEASVLNNLGHARLASNQLSDAAASLYSAIALLDSLRTELSDAERISIFDTQAHTYNLLQQVLVAQGDYGRALEISEQGRARAFAALVADSDRPPNLITLEQIKALAKQLNTTLVEYAIIPAESFKIRGKQRGEAAEIYVWVVSPTEEIYFRAVDLAAVNPTLTALVSQSRTAIGARSRLRSIRVEADESELTGEPLKALHQLLIEPVADLLPADPEANLVFIPHEILFLVPFAALQTPLDRYLIESHTLSIAPSMQLLHLTQSSLTQNAAQLDPHLKALVVGNPEMPSLPLSLSDTFQPLAPLPGAEQEAIAIAQLLKTNALLGEMATETRVAAQMEQAPLIHLATHGLLDLNLPTADFTQLQNPGAIALAPSTTADGWLTSPEIAALDLEADLVVLSACDTGLGEITGDGVVGLARSLLGAGAKSTVVSLWAVPDAPTAELMVAFYQQLFAGRGKAHALRQAMLHTKANHPNPRDWAAFVLIGNPG
ncbi:CHAT domain-containing protein [Sphaerothrix gracilis]|uniref:CHAT domain-containing protein n=1 Tax=Sphaerothrix gracilis TaxID=3151835 RepID=UPI0031FD765B